MSLRRPLCALKTVVRAGSETFDWQRYDCSFDSGASTSVRLYIGDGGGTHFFDDSQLH